MKENLTGGWKWNNGALVCQKQEGTNIYTTYIKYDGKPQQNTQMTYHALAKLLTKHKAKHHKGVV